MDDIERKTRANWADMVNNAPLVGLAKVAAQHMALHDIEERVILTCSMDPRHAAVLNKDRVVKIQSALSDYLGLNVQLRVVNVQSS